MWPQCSIHNPPRLWGNIPCLGTYIVSVPGCGAVSEYHYLNNQQVSVDYIVSQTVTYLCCNPVSGLSVNNTAACITDLLKLLVTSHTAGNIHMGKAWTFKKWNFETWSRLSCHGNSTMARFENPNKTTASTISRRQTIQIRIQSESKRKVRNGQNHLDSCSFQILHKSSCYPWCLVKVA